MKDSRLYLVHMIEHARKIDRKMAGVTRESFNNDDTLQLAVVHLIQIVGEAARLVDDQTRETLPQIPWKSVTGMRHRLVHDYTRVDLDVVWLVITQKIPELIAVLSPIIDPLTEGKKPE